MAGHFSSIARSACDWSLYPEVFTQRTRRTVGYFALVMVLSSLLVSMTVTLELRRFFNQDLKPILREMPVVTIKNHEASANVPQPWVRTFPGETGTGMTMVFIIDTTGQTTGFKPDEMGFLLTRTHLYLKNQMKEQPLDLREVDDMVIDPKAIAEGKVLPKVLWGTFATCAVLLPFYFTLAKLLHLVMLSLIGLIATSSRRRPIPFGRLMTLSLYALTPAILLDMLRSVTGLNIPLFWLIYLAVGAGYLMIALRKIPDEDPAIHVAPPPQQPPPPGSVQL
jgi:hypothetical protein